jgi:hypothetical protein
MDATLTELRVTPAGLATAMKDAPGRLAPRPAEAGDDAVLREHGLLDGGRLTETGLAWFQPLREPTYVFRIERSVAGLEAAQSFYVSLDTLRAVHVAADGEDAYALTQLPVADVIYSGIIEAAGIWPGTHPPIELGTPAPEFDEDSSLVTTLVVLHDQGDGFTEHELSWVDLDEEGVWRIEDDALLPAGDSELGNRIPPLLHVLDR